MKDLNVLHIASFNGNIGDNANHNGFRNRLSELVNRNIKYTELEMREFYQSWNLKNFNSQEFIDLCNNHHLVIIGGGNFFELKWDYSNTGTTVDLAPETISKISTPILFHGVGCDVAKGASEEATRKFELFLDNITKLDNFFISVRNDGSYKTIKSLYGDKFDNDIIRVPDGAFFMKIKDHYYPELLEGYNAVGVNIVCDMKEIRFASESNNSTEISYNDYLNKLANVINNFLDKNRSYQIILFPHIFSDLEAINDLLKNIKDEYRRIRVVIAPCLTGPGSEDYIFGLYTKCDFIMGMRFHSNVCSISQNVPTIALSSYKKINDLYSEIGLDNRVVKVNQNGFETKLQDLINDTLIQKDEISTTYSKVNKEVYKESLYFYDNLKKWLATHNLCQ